eukprot:TRINITY_DN12744_c0_g2_i3.p1 TRINITY_DN12744_c0_g2~~TRINITY_DN12744_c0_g2_i3.p1  ORF type:complete len:347 (+),score=15.23 TRINITY_DN12744_c0_g2_i3:110-1150(+)
MGLLGDLRNMQPSPRDTAICIAYLSASICYGSWIYPMILAFLDTNFAALAGGWLQTLFGWAGYACLLWAAGPTPSNCLLLIGLGVCRPTSLWTWLIGTFDDWQLYMLFPVVYGPIYFLNGLFYMAMENYWFPKEMLACKQQPKLKVVWVEDYARMFTNQMSSFYVYAPVALGIYYCCQSVVSPIAVNEAVPPPLALLHDLFFSIVVEEFIFYYIHITMHKSPTLYRLIHKAHHEFKAPVAFGSCYGHPFEHVCMDMPPGFLCAMLLRGNGHLYSAFFYQLFTLTAGQEEHCGFILPWRAGEIEHEIHHEKNDVNYGVLGMCDYLHGTSHVALRSTYTKAKSQFKIW